MKFALPTFKNEQEIRFNSKAEKHGLNNNKSGILAFRKTLCVTK